jgi:DNA-binding transcriptional regulator YiaG
MPTATEIQATTHCCEKRSQKRSATAQHPYHNVGSGLQHVYLVGITYYICPECNKQAAEIPAMKELHEALARAIVFKTSTLTGPEVRFLRKRLAKKAIEFAPMISLTPEYLSSVENNPDPVDPGRDKLVRLIYRVMSDDKRLKDIFAKQQDFQRWITSIHNSGMGDRIVASRLSNNQWKVEAEPIAA